MTRKRKNAFLKSLPPGGIGAAIKKKSRYLNLAAPREGKRTARLPIGLAVLRSGVYALPAAPMFSVAFHI